MYNKMISKLIYGFILIVIIFQAFSFIRGEKAEEENPKFIQIPFWDFRSVDTVKYSRDLADQMRGNPKFDDVIDTQTGEIASLGASHIAISTPYDPEFLPFLKRWVKSAREHNLKVWFRGNFSGWEEWFNHQRISRDEHKKLLEEFIVNNADLFEDGDIFTSCPECENGGPGDPRSNGDLIGHRKFLIEEYQISERSFNEIGRKVKPGFYSMNYDVANLVMDEETTNQLGNLIVIDHYIKDAKQLARDAAKIADHGKGQVVLGEFGAPIPDIHGEFSEEMQRQWIEEALAEIEKTPEVIGVNYWTNVGGSTGIWNEDGYERKAADALKKFYKLTKTIEIR